MPTSDAEMATASRTDWPALKARVDNRLSRYLFKAPLRLRNTQAIVSFTFDDFPQSVVTTGIPLLDRYDAKATLYVAGDMVGKPDAHWQGVSADDIVALHRRGHEIACHTFSHVRTTDLDATDLANEIDRNRSYLLGLDPSIRIENFAYPYGAGAVWRKAQLGQTFRSSRGIIPGVNSGVVDLQYLRSSPLIDRSIDPDGIDRVFDELIASDGWLIFYGHDVADRPSPYGCTPALLAHALEAAKKRNVAIMTVAAALHAAGA